MSSTTENHPKVSQKLFRAYLQDIAEVPVEDIIAFMSLYGRKNSDFVLDVLTHFAPHIQDNENLSDIILKASYQDILRQKTKMSSRKSKKIFEHIEEFSNQVEDDIALGHNQLAFSILCPCIRYSSKVLYRIEHNDRMLKIHLRLFDQLEALVQQTKAPQLREHIFQELSELASTFYYFPYHLTKNLFVVLISLKVYGEQEMTSLLIDKYESTKDAGTRHILGLYILQERLSNQEQASSPLLNIDILRNHKDDFIFMESLAETKSLEKLDKGCIDLLERHHQKSNSIRLRKAIFGVLIQSRPASTLSSFLVKHLAAQFDAESWSLLLELSDLDRSTLIDTLVAEADFSAFAQLHLIMNLLLEDKAKQDTIFSLFEDHFSPSLMQSIGSNLLSLNPERTYEVLEKHVLGALESSLGSSSTAYANEILYSLNKTRAYKLEDKLRKSIKAHYGHRKSLVRELA